MFIFRAFFVLLVLNIFSTTKVFAENFSVPKFTSSVVDKANFLPPFTQDKLRAIFSILQKQGIAQLAFLSVNSLNGESLEEASIRVVDQWKLGDKEKDNGILLFFTKKERKVRIEVGQGLEGVLTDAKSSQIIRQVIVPLMKQGKTNEATLYGLYAIVESISNKNIAKQLFGNSFSSHKKLRKKKKSSFLFVIFLLFFLMGGRGGFFSLFLISQLGGRSSGFGGGGFGGGGFGGGGGGGFSGGGASGSW
ncbi:MAG: TPM domain-containing protein [Bdellovibrionaceae bacterium]|nr:TPM domain-containing protein [Pseudobdellovibrionaceae bacterium]